MEKEVAIEIKNLNKTFYLHDDMKFTLRSLFTGIFKNIINQFKTIDLKVEKKRKFSPIAFVKGFFNQGRTRKFHVLNDLNAEIYKGEFVGIIGKNGSGKSTLLKMIAGIFEPDKGSTLKVDGNLVPFLELGVGFNHELSGRENIYLNGTILGMTKKYIDEKFDEIVKLSELDNFINEPVKNYSSGMQVRLAFSIAVQADADIFILDEVLSVGDERFQAKSVGKVKELVAAGKTVLFVSHEIEEIKEFCNRVMFIDEGKISYFGDTEEAVRIYHEKYQITDKK